MSPQTCPKRRSPPMENVRAHDERRTAKTAKPTADPTTSAKGLLKHRTGKAEKADQGPQR